MAMGCRYILRSWSSVSGYSSALIGTLPTELATLTALARLCVRCPHPPCLYACAVTGLWTERGGGVGCRGLSSHDLTGTLPSELGNMDALTWLCVRCPHPQRLDACVVTGLWTECGGGVRCRYLYNNGLTGTLPSELGNMDALYDLCVRLPHPPRLDACAVTGLWTECGGDVGCRYLSSNGITGTLPTELATMDALTSLCVRLPHPPRLDACVVAGMWTECGGDVQDAILQRSGGDVTDRAGHHGRAAQPVRAQPSPTAPGRVRRHRVVD